MFEEKNTGTNLPAQIELYATDGDEYHFLFMAKGGGSANKSLLFQETKALLNPKSLAAFLDQKLRSLGTAACPPYHLAVVIGGTSAEYTLKVAKLASARYLDRPADDAATNAAARIRDRRVGAEGPRDRAHDRHRRAVRRQVLLPRRARDPPAAPRRELPGRASRSAARRIARRSARSRATACSSSSSRPIPRSTCPTSRTPSSQGEVVKIDLSMPMSEIRATLSRYPIKTRLSLTGPMIVARDIAHAKLKERLDRGEGLPQYIKDHCGLLRGPGEDAGGLRVGLVRADDGRPHGQLRRPVPGARRHRW